LELTRATSSKKLEFMEGKHTKKLSKKQIYFSGLFIVISGTIMVTITNLYLFPNKPNDFGDSLFIGAGTGLVVGAGFVHRMIKKINSK